MTSAGRLYRGSDSDLTESEIIMLTIVYFNKNPSVGWYPAAGFTVDDHLISMLAHWC